MKISNFETSEKQAQMLELLKYGTVMVFVDSRHKGVMVPDYLKNDFQLRLNFDYSFEIDDFRVLPDRLEASLSFNKQNFFCVVPFDSVYLLLNHGIQRGSLFAEAVPVEMLEIFSGFQKYDQQNKVTLKPVAPLPDSPAPAASPITPTEPSQVATVSPAAAPAREPDNSANSAQSNSATNSEPKTKKRGSHLRVVK